MTEYDFETQLKFGQVIEQKVGDFLGFFGNISWANAETQKKGIDFFLNGYSFEVKADFLSSKTGNYYFELALPEKQGWVYTSKANRLILVSGNFLRFTTLKYLISKINYWLKCYRVVECRNENNYNSIGLLVPMKEVNGLLTTFDSSPDSVASVFSSSFPQSLLCRKLT